MGALMYDPPHPGEVVLDGCLGEESVASAARHHHYRALCVVPEIATFR